MILKARDVCVRGDLNTITYTPLCSLIPMWTQVSSPVAVSAVRTLAPTLIILLGSLGADPQEPPWKEPQTQLRRRCSELRPLPTSDTHRGHLH